MAVVEAVVEEEAQGQSDLPVTDGLSVLIVSKIPYAYAET